MSRLNPFTVRVKQKGLYNSDIEINPAVGHDHNWTAKISNCRFYWKTKKQVMENLKRIYGNAEEL